MVGFCHLAPFERTDSPTTHPGTFFITLASYSRAVCVCVCVCVSECVCGSESGHGGGGQPTNCRCCISLHIDMNACEYTCIYQYARNQNTTHDVPFFCSRAIIPSCSASRKGMMAIRPSRCSFLLYRFCSFVTPSCDRPYILDAVIRALQVPRCSADEGRIKERK